MSINDLEFLQGAAFLRLLKGTSYISISYLSSIHLSLYIIKNSNQESAILFKISKKPTSSWSFSFSSQEENALTRFHQTYPDVKLFIALICHRDGVCCLSEQQLWTIIDPSEGLANQRVSVKRELRGSYYVKGTGRVPLEHTVPQNNWPDVILSTPNNL
ncbi:MAG: hypothetical protein RMY29_002805 [Nostoc sp. CreGUA01]|uniref:Uncharacterized protein n=1 Tax=Desmonostoc muscorum LEGE 12446 TaxID=1828758 RepID=A0A8J6ZKB2_DESMC|nr:hypothetical protein [Desmonostoc muscorum]MCF2148550.1 hypothetical protein [Desmonostoc muscorum LEGE 12446]MDZ8039640.1 hypothetical protein [Nostoc sp. CreGUA01]